MKAAIIGAGVIGAGWAARFLLHGWDVRVFDPADSARERLPVVVDAARASLPQLYDAALPAEGCLELAPTLDEALQGVDWVQESAPENLEMKRRIYAAIPQTVGASTPIGSSTSGFKPSALALGADAAPADARLGAGVDVPFHAANLLVCHPFNPVYLLPLVEVAPSRRTNAAVTDRALQVLASIGMKPVLIRREIDAHIADRLLEAVWREALWLVHDGVATTGEIDAVIRYGFGPRWAQMGLFESYRIAGGDAGMRHFLAQFGPALKWPWSKLTNVPELTDDLIERIAAQSDEQAAGASVRELEKRRDGNLVAIFRALKRTDQGVGEVLNQMDARLEGSMTAARRRQGG